MNKFNIGDAVLFVNGYGGDNYSTKMYRWGYLALGFVTQIEYIHDKKPIYVLGTESPVEKLHPVYRTLGEHLLFKVDEKIDAVAKLMELCEDPEVL